MIEITVTPLEAGVGIALLVGFAAWWAYRLHSGVVFHPFGEAAVVAFYLGVFFVVEGGSWLGFTATAPLDLALLALAGAAGAFYTFDASRIVRLPDRRIGYRSRAAIPIAWLLLLGLEILVQVVLLGGVTFLNAVTIEGIPNPLAGATPGFTDPSGTSFAVVDALFAISTGLIIGQSVGVFGRLSRLLWGGRGFARRPAPGR